ncbi:MAG TPA: nickel-type superoxide dismutase maturation protease [Candidatus Limnocylindrales bacterium]|nr:nickel-type superoxide dismutase maturation protease [Candidatus Limnocylindrales bacterium]
MLLKLIKFSPIANYAIKGNSMSPTLKPGQNVLVSRMSYLIAKPKIGDIIAVKDPGDGKTIIKRISEVKNNKYFVLGDNKEHSTDSRKFGMLDRQNIIGKVIFPKT